MTYGLKPIPDRLAGPVPRLGEGARSRRWRIPLGCSESCRARTAVLALVTCWLACSSPPELRALQSPSEVPPVLAALVDTLNTGELETIQAFVTRHYPPERMERATGYWSAVARELGPLVFHGFDATSGGPPGMTLPFFWGANTRAWVGIELDVTPDHPMRIDGSSVTRGLVPASLAPSPPIPVSAMIDSLRTYLMASSAGDHFSGVVVVAKNGRLLFEGAYGLSDRERNVPNTLETPFALASVTKLFTGVAIAQLVELGLLSYEDPLAKWLPEYPAPIANQTTLRHLLTHTSNIELDGDSAYNDEVVAATTLDDLLTAQLQAWDRAGRSVVEAFEPTGAFDYTNEGIDLLGLVIERASGQSWGEYIRANVFEPAGMGSSGTDFLAGIQDLAKWYTLRDADDPGRWITGSRREVRPGQTGAPRLRPAGTGWATAGDLVRFFDALEDGRLLSRKAWETVTTPHVIVPGPPGRGYGFAIGTQESGAGLRQIGHTGSGPGMSTVVEHYPDAGWTVVILSNYDRAALWVNMHIRRLIGTS